MKDLLMLKGAKTLVDVCTKVKHGESVLIVTDMTKMDIAKAVASVAYDRGAEVVVSVMEPRERASQEPPKAIAEGMKVADVVFSPVGHSITHTHAVKDAAAAGTRIIVMTDFTREMMMGGGIEADFDALKPICKGVAQRFAEGRHVRLTTPGGTDLSLDITGRRGNSLYCVVEPGEFSTAPTVEANVSPVEGSAEGVIVADASVPYLGIGVLREPIRLVVEKGFIVDIQGGAQAKTLYQDLKAQNDPNSFNVAELGVGLNPWCRMLGIMLEDEGVQGTAHIGIGTSITLGGTIKAPCHYDALMWDPRIEVDGVPVINGKNVLL